MVTLRIGIESFEFVFFEDASHNFSDDEQVWCIRLRDKHDRHFDALYFPGKGDNFIVQSRFDTTEQEIKKISIAAFCFLSATLINSGE